MIRPRFFAKWLAYIGGFFWLRCPICNEHFAGFEVGSPALMQTQSSGRCICSKPQCSEIAEHRNNILSEKMGLPIISSASRTRK